MSRARLLLLSPIMPDESGNGLAMRAGVALSALAQRFEVHLGLIPIAGASEQPSALVRRCAASLQSLPLADQLDPHFGLIERLIDDEQRRCARLSYPKPYLCRFCTSRSAAVISEWVDARGIGALHVLRLYLAPLIEPLASRSNADRPSLVLDLDEDEVAARGSLAALYRRQGAADRAEAETLEASKYATLLARLHGAFDRLLVSSPLEAQRAARVVDSLQTVVLPNAAPPGAMPAASRPRTQDRHRLLFVGNLNYEPNRDGIVFLCREILPRLRASLPHPVEVMLAGRGLSPEVATIAEAAGARLLGYVEDLRALYAEADIALVPLRAGGGTRIKVLEAFAHGTPVVATAQGIEGIAAIAGAHALVADSADEFAAACRLLLTTPQLADQMAQRARSLIQSNYRRDQVEALLTALYDQLDR